MTELDRHRRGTSADASGATGPGLSEILIGLTFYLACIFPLAIWLSQIPVEQAAFRGIAGMAINGIAGTCAVAAARVYRIRTWRSFGFRSVNKRWMVTGLVLGLVAVGLSIAIEHSYSLFIQSVDTQADFKLAAKSGLFPLMALILSGALLTPFGEEILFRGIIANALNRYGWMTGIVGSAAVFGLVHGPSVILLDAFMVGILTGALFRRTNSIWPGLALHVVYNCIWLLLYTN